MQKFAYTAIICAAFIGAGCSSSSESSVALRSGDVRAVSPSAGVPVVTSSPMSTSSPTATATPTPLAFPGVLPAEQIHDKQVRITTDYGDIVIKLYDDTAPNTVSNFVQLAQNHFYDGVIFHRVISGFMIQGGDPTGTGMGGPGYKFADELNDDRTYARGTVAMANAGPNTNGSQFFIMHADYPLPHDYTIFGQVIAGMDVVDKIASTPTNGHPPMGSDRPLSDQIMTKVTVEDRE